MVYNNGAGRRIVMEIGKRIQSRRKELGLTQKDLSQKVHVTVQAISQWENGKTYPDISLITELAKALDIDRTELIDGTLTETPAWMIKEKFFSEKNMYRKLKEFAAADGLPETDRAIDYALKKHAGQKRKTSMFTDEPIPYIVHPFIMTCHAHAIGIRDDVVLTTALLHDVCEDCGIKPEELPFSEPVRKAVSLLTKTEKKTDEYQKRYYDAIAGDPTAAIVKIFDRCNNVSAMILGFSKERVIEYINETEQYVYPLIEYVKKNYRQYYDAVFILNYQIMSIIESIKGAVLKW